METTSGTTDVPGQSISANGGEKPPDGVVRTRVLAPARPVLVGQRTIAREVRKHPALDTPRDRIREQPIGIGRDQRRPAKEIDRRPVRTPRQKKLRCKEQASMTRSTENRARSATLAEEALERTIEAEIARNHVGRGESTRHPTQRELHADETARAVNEHVREGLRRDRTEMIGDTDLDELLTHRTHARTKLDVGDCPHPTIPLAVTKVTSTDTEPAGTARYGDRARRRRINGNGDISPHGKLYQGNKASSHERLMVVEIREAAVT